MSEQPKCTLRDAELLTGVEKWVSKLCYTGGRTWTLSVPVNFNRDPDILITELCKRYADLLARHNALRHNTKVIIKAYRENRKKYNALVDAARNTFVVYDRMAPSLKNYCAARAEVDRLMEER